MANAIIARMQGDDYQARYFWMKACRLFKDYSKVVRVGYDVEAESAPKAFDDVTVHYSQPVPDGRGGLITADFYQVKFHVNHNGAFTTDALINPAFIGATSFSLLQRLKQAQDKQAASGKNARFIIISPWNIDPNDPLASIIGNQSGEVRLSVLFDGTTDTSKMGKVRKKWREHLGLKTNDELHAVLLPLRINVNGGTLSDIQDKLDDRLQLAGLAPVPAEANIHPYDDLIRKVRATGRAEFSKNDIQKLAVDNKLWIGQQKSAENTIIVGLRSFWRWAEHMEDETAHMLCLLPHFDGRTIKQSDLWHSCVYEELSGFLSETMRGQDTFHLQIDAHSTIAFAAGYCLDSKCGAKVALIQKSRQGKIVWDPNATAVEVTYPEWDLQEVALASGGGDVALALCVTHDVVEDVRLYVERELPQVGRILVYCVAKLLGATAITDGVHAHTLAQSLAVSLKANRSMPERMAHLHVFAAAPNALMFFAGQHARAFGRFTLYEFDFDLNTPGAYQSSLSFPPPNK